MKRVKKQKHEGKSGPLARMMPKGFAEMLRTLAFKEDLVAVTGRLGAVESRLGRVEFRFEELHDILERVVDSEVLNLQKRVNILEKGMRTLTKHLLDK